MNAYLYKNPESIKYYDRLVNEWQTHGKIIIGIDYDDTISPWKFKDFDYEEIIKILKEAKNTGAYLVIFTACRPDRYDEIRQYCTSKGLEIDSINENPIDLPYGHEKKIYANIFLDDRAGLNEALNILEHAMYTIRGKQHSHFIEIG